MTRRSTVLLALILLFAAAIRFYRIDAQSLWSDEGSSVAQAVRDLPAIVDNAARDIHPPLYYILLHFWVIPFGTSEAAVRGTVGAPGCGAGRALLRAGNRNRRPAHGYHRGTAGGIEPFPGLLRAGSAHVHADDAAGSRVRLRGAQSSCSATPISNQRERPAPRTAPLPARRIPWGWYGVYAIAAILGLYTHYFFPIVLVVANAIFFLYLYFARRHAQPASPGNVAAWLAVQAGVALTFLPWLPTAVRQITTWPSGAQTFTAAEAPLVILRTLAEGLSAPRDDGLWLALFALLLVVGALPFRARRSSPPPANVAPPRGDQAPVIAMGLARADDPFARSGAYQTAILLVYLLAPFAVMFALALFKDSFLKFMLVASPPFVLLVAGGITRLSDAFSGIVQRLTHPARSTSPISGMAHFASFRLHPSSFILFLPPSSFSCLPCLPLRRCKTTTSTRVSRVTITAGLPP